MKRKHRLIGFSILGLLILGIAAILIVKNRSSNASAIQYRQIPVTRGDLNVTVLSTGLVQPENRLEIRPPVPGRIETILIREGQFVRKGDILAWMSSTERAALLDAARAKGDEEWKRWKELYKATPILAPIAGTIILKSVEEGQTFASTDTVLVMSDRLTIKAQVDETDIGQVALRQKAKIVLDAYPSTTIDGVVDQIAYEAKTVNNVTTYTVDILPTHTPPFMRSGMTANVTVFVAAKRNILLIPNEAIKIRDRARTVLVKGPSNSTPQEQDVNVGLSDGKQTEISDGLSENDVILLAELKTKSDSPKSSNPFMPNMPRPRGTSRGH